MPHYHVIWCILHGNVASFTLQYGAYCKTLLISLYKRYVGELTLIYKIHLKP